jgi:protein-S-isoprenylcysteine O-methyltransferase Ste14
MGMKRVISFFYGLACYGVFLVTLLYAIGFLGNFAVPKSIDSGPTGSIAMALLIDGALLAMFAMQHSIMARPWFKRAWTRIVPEPVERSTYVLFSSVAMLVLFWQWQPIGGTVWSVGGAGAAVILGVYAAGQLLLLLSTFLINHFDLFGLRQVWLYLLGRKYEHVEFHTPFFYRYVRHPLYVGWLSGSGDDGGAPVLRSDDDGVHPGSDPLRRGRPASAARREISPVSRGSSDDCSGAADVGAGAASKPVVEDRGVNGRPAAEAGASAAWHVTLAS